jgi:hypothetical protein
MIKTKQPHENVRLQKKNINIKKTVILATTTLNFRFVVIL